MSNLLTPAALIARLEALVAAKATTGFDTEGINWMTCCGFATREPARERPWQCLVVDTLGLKGTPCCKDVWRALAQVIEDPAVTKVCWNAAHERAFLQLRHGLVLRGYHDVMFAFHERYPELPKGLKYAASILTRLPCWTEGISWAEDDDRPAVSGERLWRYNVMDCAATLQLAYHPQLREVMGL